MKMNENFVALAGNGTADIGKHMSTCSVLIRLQSILRADERKVFETKLATTVAFPELSRKLPISLASEKPATSTY